MDTSTTYIKMCSKAVEIQEMWKPIGGDVFIYNPPVGLSKPQIMPDQFTKPELSEALDIFIKCYIWLPRQDQLQEMVGKYIWALTLGFEYFLRTEGTYNIREYPYQFTSMEQLWLAFVMNEKYGKVWNGEDWIGRDDVG